MGTKRRVIIELAETAEFAETAAMAATVNGRSKNESTVVCLPTELEGIAGLSLDHQFKVDLTPPERVATATASISLEETPTVLFRGEIEDTLLERGLADLGNDVRIYADPVIEALSTTCINSPALGDSIAVKRLLGVEGLHSTGHEGDNVLVAIVDTGINVAHLRKRGLSPELNSEWSWAYDEHGATPGEAPVDHGTMCAFDALIGAPRCTLLDIALLRRATFETQLSDAVRAYAHLLNIVRRLPDETKGVIVSNSWGMYHSSWDIAVGQPGNYSDNSNHPFNRIVGTLASAGVDILFAAGNCGQECPHPRCQGATNGGITGANSHPQALCIAGIDINKKRVGYSSMGPGRLIDQKPDLSTFTHFDGSRTEGKNPDSGTSAATPVAAGALAAVRSKFPRHSATPKSMREFLRNTAESPANRFDYEYGWGILNVASAVDIRALPS